MAQRGALGPIGSVLALRQEFGSHVLAVRIAIQNDCLVVTLDQATPRLLREPANLAALAQSLNLRPSDLLTFPPPRVVSTGADHLLVADLMRDIGLSLSAFGNILFL
jgi:predicted PhzF superfamily epimerase YddE/YHI9